MSHTRFQVATAMILATAVIGCGDDPASRISGTTSASYGDQPPYFASGCNGGNGTQFKIGSTGSITKSNARGGTAAFGETFGQLQQVIVYGNPVQRPNRGYGAPELYGGMTNTYIYDRNALDQCSFGTGSTFTVVGPVADDTLGVPVEAPDGIPEDVWRSLPPRVTKQLREAAWYLADHWIPNDIPAIGLLTREARRGLIFSALANGYNRAQELRVSLRRETEMFERFAGRSTYGFSENESLRVDALLLGCSTMESFRELRSWNADQAESYASRVVAGWASDVTQSYEMRYLEPQLSRLAAVGAQMARDGTSCGSAARYHFEQRPTDLYDVPRAGSGGTYNPFQL